MSARPRRKASSSSSSSQHAITLSSDDNDDDDNDTELSTEEQRELAEAIRASERMAQDEAYRRSQEADSLKEAMEAAAQETRQQQRRRQEREARRKERALARLKAAGLPGSTTHSSTMVIIGLRMVARPVLHDIIERHFDPDVTTETQLLQWAAVERAKHFDDARLPNELKLSLPIKRIKLRGDQPARPPRTLRQLGFATRTLLYCARIDE